MDLLGVFCLLQPTVAAIDRPRSRRTPRMRAGTPPPPTKTAWMVSRSPGLKSSSCGMSLPLSNRIGDAEVAHASYADAGRRKLRQALAIVCFHGAANRQRIVTTVPSKRSRGLQPSEVEVQKVMLAPPCGGDPPSRVALLLLQPQPSASSPLVPRSTTPSTPNDISSADQIFAAAAQGLRQRSWRPAPDISAGWATCILHLAT